MSNEPSISSERRQRRSHVPGVALQLYLEHLTKSRGYEAITLSTQDGLLVGGAGEGYDHDLLGALASLGDEIHTHQEDVQLASRGNSVRFYGFNVGEHLMNISCVGGASFPLEECASAVRRIHSSQLAA